MDYQIPVWLGWVSGSVVLSFLLFYLFSGKALFGGKRFFAFAGVTVLSGVLGAKLFYYVCQIDFMIADGWLPSLLRFDPDALSFFGGVAGVCLGAAWGARLCGRKPMAVLDAFAPFGLFLGALIRFGEHWLGLLGAGAFLEDEALWFFPLARGIFFGDDWWEWYLAVYVFEGICLLITAVIARFRFHPHRFLRSLFYLCLPQILLENLRSSSMMWFFCVRVEQLACMVTMTVILSVWCARSRKSRVRWLPVVVALLCAGLFIVCEFAMEGKIEALLFLSPTACYVIMLAGLVVLAFTECRAHAAALKGSQIRDEVKPIC